MRAVVCDGAVQGIAQDAGEVGSAFEGDFEGHGEQLKFRISLYLSEDLIEGRSEAESLIADQHGNFEQAQGTECQRYSVPNRRFETTNLLARQLFPVLEPAHEDVGIQQEAGVHWELFQTVVER